MQPTSPRTLSVTIPAALDPDALSRFLSAKITASLGEPWLLEARFAVPRKALCNSAHFEIQWQLGESACTFNGHTISLAQRPLNPEYDELEICASAVSFADQFELTQCVYPCAKGLAPILRKLFGDETKFHIPENLFPQANELQWIQYDESNLNFVRRLAHQKNCFLCWLPEPQHPWCTITPEHPSCGEPVHLPSEVLRTCSTHHRTGQKQLCLTTTQSGLYPGKKITIANNENIYLIQCAEHQIILDGTVLGHGTNQPYQCKLTLLAEEQWRKPVALNPTRPMLYGRIAYAQQNQDSPPFHSNGNYPILFDFESRQHLGWGSLPLLQPYGGPHGGTHVALESGTVVLCGFGINPDQPIILGTLANLGTARLTDHSHPRRQAFQTQQGLCIFAEDLEDGGSSLTITTARGQQISLDSSQDLLELCVAQNRIAINGKQQTIHLETKAGVSLQLEDSSQSIRVFAKQGIQHKSSEHTFIEIDAKQNITLQSEGTLTLQGKSIIIQSQGDLECNTEGTLQLQGKSIYLN